MLSSLLMLSPKAPATAECRACLGSGERLPFPLEIGIGHRVEWICRHELLVRQVWFTRSDRKWRFS
jgi:hypothetical protein